jgi:cell division protease FtsH
LHVENSIENDFFATARHAAHSQGRERICAEDLLTSFRVHCSDNRMTHFVQEAFGCEPEALLWPDILTRRAETIRSFSGTKIPPRMPWEPSLETLLSRAYVGSHSFKIPILLLQLTHLDHPVSREWLTLNASAGRRPQGSSLSLRLGKVAKEGLSLVEFLSSRIYGQDRAIQEIADSTMSSRLRPAQNGPREIITLMGPPGSGKTMLARALADYRDKQTGNCPLLILDMSTYRSGYAQEKLWGFSKAYTQARPGILTNFVKEHPEGIVLFDELEKASHSNLQALLGVLDRGKGTDEYHEKEIDFSRATLIFTTNIGKERLATQREPLDRVSLLDILKEEGAPEQENQDESGPLLSSEFVSRLGKGMVLALSPLRQSELLKVFQSALHCTLEKAGAPPLELPEDAEALLLLQHAQGLDARKANAVGIALGDRILLELVQAHGPSGSKPAPNSCRMELSTESSALLRCKLDATPIRLLLIGEPGKVAPQLESPGLSWTAYPDEGEATAWLLNARPDAILALRPVSSNFVPPDGIPFEDFPFEKDSRGLPQRIQRFLDPIRRDSLFKEQVRSHKALKLDITTEFREVGQDQIEMVLVVDKPTERRFIRHRDLDAPIGMMERPEGGFDQIIGQAAAKKRLARLAEQLRRPSLNNPPAKGYLLAGPPGTGKTRLARALAAEAGVPFFAVGPGDLASRWKDEGAVRIREVFALAREYAPSVVFIDEVDAIGSSRALQEHSMDSRQILNTLLTCMDGIEPGDRPVFVLGATNRRDLLDGALLRPGRFDATIPIELPRLEDRKAMLQSCLNGIQGQPVLNLEILAQRSSGFSHAGLEGMVREARTIAGWEGRTTVTIKDLKVTLDTARTGARAEGSGHSVEMQKLVAAHEAGHAIVQAALLPKAPVARIDIVPRANGIGGVTEHIPAEGDWGGLNTRKGLRAEIAALMGGRAGEFLAFGSDDLVSDGCQGDLDQATKQVRRALTRGGLDPVLGLMSLQPGNQIVDPATESKIQARTASWLTEGYDQALVILRANRKTWRRLVNLLIKKEALEGEELQKVLSEVKDPALAVQPKAKPQRKKAGLS